MNLDEGVLPLKARLLALCLFILLISVLPAAAQEATPTAGTGVNGAVAAITNNNLWLYGFPGGPLQVTTDAGRGFVPPYYHSPVWSPDGVGLAFIRVDEDYVSSLMYLDTTQEPLQPVMLASNLEAGFPVIFNDDGSEVIYVSLGDITAQPYRVNANSIGTLNRAAPRLLGTFQYGVGCGGGSPYPVDRLYNLDAGYGASALLLAVSPFGLLHSINCSGTGAALLNLDTGVDSPLIDTLARAALSPDGLRLAGVTGTNTDVQRLALYDLQNRSLQELNTQAVPDQIGWSADGAKIYYSVRVSNPARVFTADPASPAYTIFINNGLLQQGETTLPLWDVALRVYDIFTATEQILYTSDAYAIGRIRAAGPYVLFSQIPNMTQWLQGIIDAGGAQTAVDADVLQTALISMNPVNAELNLLGLDIEQAAYTPALIPPFAAFVGGAATAVPLVQANADGTVNVGEVVVRQFSVTSAVDGAGCAVDNTQTYTPGATVNASVSMDNLKPGTTLDVVWARDGQAISTGSYQHTGNFTQGCLYFFITQTSTPAGTYTATLKVNGQDAAIANFVVQ